MNKDQPKKPTPFPSTLSEAFENACMVNMSICEYLEKLSVEHRTYYSVTLIPQNLDRVSEIPQLPHTKMRSPHEVAQLRELRKTAVPSVPPASLEITVNINLPTVNPPNP